MAQTRQHSADDGYRRATAPVADVDGGASAVVATLASASAPTYTSPDWVQQTPTQSPSGRYGNAMAYDEAHHQVILFGGTDGTNYMADTWLWNGAGWVQAQPATSPPARAWAQMAYDEGTGTVVLFGGETPATPAMADTWSWNGTTWTELTPSASPPARSDAAMAYDRQTGQLVLFGGSGYSAGSGTADLGDTWSWNGSTWTQITGTTAPSARTGGRATFDAARGYVVLFGGVQSATATYLSDTWVFNGTSWAAAAASASPAARADFYLGYDDGLPDAVLFGGYAGNSGDVNDTWEWDGTTWKLAAGIAAPSGRDGGTMAFDMASGQLLQFGGSNGFTNYHDTWTYNTGTPTITDSVTPTMASRGSYVAYTIVVGDASPTYGISGATLHDTIPNDVLLVPAPVVTVVDVGTGNACGTCQTGVAGQAVSVTGMNIAAHDSFRVTFSAYAVGSDRACEREMDSATAAGPSGSDAPVGTALTICDTGLGLQPWWSFGTWTTGPGGAVAVNPANGNAVVTQDDSTFIADEGDLGFGVSRTYNTKDTQTQALPLSIGGGWVTTIGEERLSPGGVTANGLVVPPSESYADDTPVTLVDTTGTRFVFLPRPVPQPVDLTAFATGSSAVGPLGALKPNVLQLDTSHYDHLCVDGAFMAPPGVHLGLWRYVELKAASASTPCTPAAGTTPAVLGFAGERTDRVRFEFAWDGHLLGIIDGNGNQLQYIYAGLPLAGAPLGHLLAVQSPATGRRLTFSYPTATQVTVVDPAGRTTAYTLDTQTPARLTSVSNPDGSRLAYSYGTCYAASAQQLCSITDARGASTTLLYDANPGDLSDDPASTPNWLGSVTDRAGFQGEVVYSPSPDSGTVNRGGKETVYLIDGDPVGRASDVLAEDSNGKIYSETRYGWDSASSTCQQPGGDVDNNLCSVTYDGGGSPQAAPSETVSYTYNAEGRRLREASSTGRVRTAGYHAQYLEAGGAFTSYNDTIGGAGTIQSDSGPGTNGQRWDAGTLLAVSDAVQSLGAIGNAASTPNWTAYLTTLRVDDNSTINPNLASPSGACATAANPAGNTGNLCEVDAPAFNGTSATITRYTYNATGARATMTTPKAVAETPAGSTPPAYVFTYYGPGDVDVTGSVTANGWLKGVTDPQGHFVALAYDQAGNVARAWDRDATQGFSLSQFPGTEASPPSSAFSETLRSATGTGYGMPWRYITSQRDPLGNVTLTFRDGNGNPTATRPPRGTANGTTAYDTTATYDARDLITAKVTPAEAELGTTWRYYYDAWGNLVDTQDPLGAVTAVTYDALNRPVETFFTRGPWPSDPTTVPPSCANSGPNDGVFPAGRITCHTVSAYDMRSNVIEVQDADGQDVNYTFDASNEKLKREAYRVVGATTMPLDTTYTYDLDGDLLTACSPNGNGAGSPCPAAYMTTKTYDVSDRLASVTTYDTIGGAANTTQYAYDADGNTVRTTDADQHTTTDAFDLLDRELTQTVPRDAAHANTTSFLYDPAGVKLAQGVPTATGANCALAAAQPSPAGCLVTAYSYDADHRLLDTVVASDNTSATAAGLVDSSGGSNIRTRVMYDSDGNPVASFAPNAFSASTTTPDPSYMVRTDYDRDDQPVARYVPRYDASAHTDESGQFTFATTSDQGSQCPTGVTPQSVTGIPAYPAQIGVCVTRIIYDADGNRSRVTLPTSNGIDNRYFTYTYTDDRLEAAVDVPSPAPSSGPRVRAATYLYDGSGRVVRATDALGAADTTTYTSDGLVQEVAGAANVAADVTHSTSYSYDLDGNRVSQTDVPTNQLVETWSYFTDDRLKTTTDGAGDETSYVYDGVGNTVQVYSPSANATPRDAANTAGSPTQVAFTWDNLPSVMTVPVAPDGSRFRQTCYTYGGAGQKLGELVGAVGPNAAAQCQVTGAQEAFSYYNDLRLHVTTGTHGETITNTYDPAGNRTTVLDSTSNETLTGTYYLDGLPRSVDDGTWATQYAYDGLGSLTGAQDIHDPGGFASGSVVSYTDDEQPATLRSNVTAPAGQSAGTTTYAYDAAGRAATSSDPNGETTTWHFNTDNTLGSIVLTSASGSTLAQWSYGYDSQYRQTTATLSGVGASSTGFVAGTFQYGYDGAGRVILFTDTTPTGGMQAEQARWDHNSDRISVGSDKWTYNADGSIASSQSGTLPVLPYSYNPDGTLQSDTCTTYVYDGFLRLTSATQQTNSQCPVPGSAPAKYTYDGLGRQVTRSDSSNTVTTFHYNGWQDHALVDHAVTTNPVTHGVTALDYLYGLDQVGAPVAVRQSGSSTEQYLNTDGYGNVSTVTSQTGAVVCTARFDAFGRPQGALSKPGSPCNTGSTIDEYFYRAGRVDATTGDYQFGARSYDPTKGTFTAPDSYRDGSPVADLQLWKDPLTANGFAYAAGDPVNFWDPTGHGLYCTLGPDCQELQATPSDDGNGGSMAAQLSAARAPGYTGAPSEHAYGSAHAKPKGVTHVAAKPPSMRIQEVEFARRVYLNGDTGSGYIPAAQDCNLVTPRDYGTMPTVDDGCDRNPGGECHNPGGFMVISCTYTDAIPGPPDPNFDRSEVIHYADCGTCVPDTVVTLLTLPFDGAEEAAAALVAKVGDAVIDGVFSKSATEVATEVATEGASTLAWGPVKPVVTEPGLQGIADQLYRPGATVGNGGTADILRAEGTHIQKAWDRAVQLQRWLESHPDASPEDIYAAHSMQQDLLSALAGEGYPGP